MTDYTNLVKALRCCADYSEKSTCSNCGYHLNGCRMKMTADAAAAIEAFEAKVPHWVSVDDSMPDLLQFVLVCNDEGKCVVAQYVGYQTDSLTAWRIAYTMYDTDIYDEKECGPVCYWMPIEPPKEDEHGN